MSILDAVSYPLDTPEGREVHASLVIAYPRAEDAMFVVALAGMDRADFNTSAKPRLLWFDILEAASRRGKLRELLATVVDDLGDGPIVTTLQGVLQAKPEPVTVSRVVVPDVLRLLAYFVFADDGREPKITYLSRRGRPHYVVTLVLRGVPAEVTEVTYVLEPDFPRAHRRVTAPHEFHHELEAYGDCMITAVIRMKGAIVSQTATLATMLRVGHLGDENPKVAEAIAALVKAAID